MQPGNQLSDGLRGELRRALLDKENMAARMEYVSEMLALIINIEDWLAIDSWLAGGKTDDTGLPKEFGQAFSEFRTRYPP
jgi:hypothetical protein